MIEQWAVYQQMAPVQRAALLFPIGTALGSFATVLLHRIPLGMSVSIPRSHCPVCGHQLGATELIPILSFLLQQGRCRSCRTIISWRYPFLEALYGAAVAGAGAWWGWRTGIGVGIGGLLGGALAGFLVRVKRNRETRFHQEGDP